MRTIVVLSICISIAAIGQAADIETGLVGHWKLDETSGAFVYDSSGSNNHGSVIGNPQWVAGKVGGGLHMDGTDDYVQLPMGLLSLTDSTFATWVNWSNVGGDWQRVFDFGSDTTYNMYLTARTDTGVMRSAITVGSWSAEQQVNAPSALPSGWHHVAVTINADADTIRLYLDGAVVAENTAATLTPSDIGYTTQNWLGRSQYSWDPYLDGALDDFRIYNRTLSDQDLQELFKIGQWASWYVDDSVPSSGDGRSWATAFKKIQEGIQASSDGETVMVAQGTYVENINFNGKNIVLTSIAPLNPTVVANTIIDGNKAGPVVTFSWIQTEACILSGFTVRNGESSGSGGGVCGGTWDDRTHATIQNNAIAGNSAYEGGGLAYCNGTIQNNTITGNSAVSGGGLYGCSGAIQNNTITGNSAQYAGGLTGCNGTIQSNIISGNSADWYGGGLLWCNGTVQNNTIAGNTGGGLFGCNGTIQNNTIARNSAEYWGGGGLHESSGTIRNCIIWGNAAPTNPQVDRSNIPTFSCIEGWTGGGAGNIAQAPQFVDPDGPDNNPATQEDNDYRLSPGSPCIDAGINEDWMWAATDLDGNPRIFHGGLSLTVDMGAYEYGSWPFRITHVLIRPTGAFQLTWNSRPGDKYVIWSRAEPTSGAWTQEQTILSAGNSTAWTGPSPGGSRGFYRVELK